MAMVDMEVVERVLLTSAGVSGARLERVTMADGRVLIAKTIDQQADWLMRATGDDGRLFRLWSRGVLQRLPAGIDTAVETVEELPSGCVVVMRDVSDSLVPAGHLLTREQSRRVVAAASSLHDAFAGMRIEGLCPLVDRLAFLTPAVARGTADEPLRGMVLEGWSRFGEVVPPPIGEAVLELIERPGTLAAALGAFPQTLLHGDLKVANLGFNGATVVMLDWGTLTGMGPRAVEHAWYLAVNGAAIDASLDELLDDAARVLAPEDRDGLPLALLGALVQLGWEKALGATSDDPATQTRERAGLEWWCARAAEALSQWSPA